MSSSPREELLVGASPWVQRRPWPGGAARTPELVPRGARPVCAASGVEGSDSERQSSARGRVGMRARWQRRSSAVSARWSRGWAKPGRSCSSSSAGRAVAFQEASRAEERAGLAGEACAAVTPATGGMAGLPRSRVRHAQLRLDGASPVVADAHVGQGEAGAGPERERRKLRGGPPMSRQPSSPASNRVAVGRRGSGAPAASALLVLFVRRPPAARTCAAQVRAQELQVQTVEAELVATRAGRRGLTRLDPGARHQRAERCAPDGPALARAALGACRTDAPVSAAGESLPSSAHRGDRGGRHPGHPTPAGQPPDLHPRAARRERPLHGQRPEELPARGPALPGRPRRWRAVGARRAAAPGGRQGPRPAPRRGPRA